MAISFSTITDPFGDTGTFDARMVFGDFDNDGDIDALYQNGNTAGSGIGVFLNNGSGSFTNFTNANSAGSPFLGFDFTGEQVSVTSVTAVDYDNDGDVDIIDRDTSLSVWRNDGGSFTKLTDPFGDTGTFDARMVFGDFDNDGDKDALYQNGNTAGAGIGYFRNDGSGSFTNFTNAASAGSPFNGFDFTGEQVSVTSVTVVDYDNDGDDDIIDRDTSLSVWRNNGGSFTKLTDPFGDTGTFDARMVFGDFDSDGDVDVLYQNGNTAGAGIGYFRNDGSGSFTNFTNANSAGTPFNGFDFTGQQVQVTSLFEVDIDNDGDVDLVDREGSLGVWRQDGAPPRLISSTPGDNATGVSASANIVLTFSEAVFGGTGNIYIRRTSDDALIETIAANGARVTGSGTTTITIDPVGTLAGSTGYYLTFDEQAFADADGAIFGVLQGVQRNAITDKTFLNFTTGAVNTPPTQGVNTGSTVAEGGLDTITSAELDFNDSEQADTAITYVLNDPATNGTLRLNGNTLGVNGTFTQDDINNNRVTYLHNGGETTSGSLSFYVTDGAGGTVTGQTFTFTVTPVNDDPQVGNAPPAVITVTEDVLADIELGNFSFSDSDSGTGDLTLTIAASAGTLSATSGGGVTVDGSGTGTITLTGTASAINAFIGTGLNDVSYQTEPNANGTNVATLTYSISDNGNSGAGGGGTVVLGTTQINANSVNDAPEGADNTVTIDEDTPYIFTAADFPFTDPNDAGQGGGANGFGGITVVIAPTNGSLFFDSDGSGGNAPQLIPSNSVITAGAIISGYLSFVPDADANGAVTFTFQVRDNGPGGGANQFMDPTPNLFTFNVTPVNDAPEGADNTIDMLEDDFHTFDASDFGFTDPIDGDSLLSVVVATLPPAGDGTLLLWDGFDYVAVTAGQVIDVTAIDNGDLIFVPADNVNGTGLGSFTFQVRDDGGTANGGQDTDQSPNTISFDIEAVNDAPTVVLQPGLDVVGAAPDADGVLIASGDGNGLLFPSGGGTTGPGTAPQEVVLADFDGNGYLDIATSNAGDGTVTILLGDGCGCFDEAPGSPNTLGGTPGGMAVGLFNNDLILDIVVADTASRNVSVLLGNGDGTFTTSSMLVYPDATGTVFDVALGDFNLDGELDLVSVGNASFDPINISFGNGAGGFSPFVSTSQAGPNEFVDVETGFINGDGIVDFVAVNRATDTVQVMHGTGGPVFFLSFGATLATGDAPTDATLGDVNGDGFVDVVVANGGDDTIGVFLGDGAGNFATQVTYAAGDGPSAVELADMDEDGDLDIVAGHADGSFHVLLGAGDGTFTPDPDPLFAPDPVTDIAVGNVDPDAESSYPLMLAYREGDVLTLAPRLVLSDVDSTMIASATIVIGGAVAGDVLAAVTTGTNITAVYDDQTFTLTLTGSDTIAAYQEVLRSVTYSSTSDDPTDLLNGGGADVRFLALVVEDDEGAESEFSLNTIILDVEGVEDAPYAALLGDTVNEFAADGTVIGTLTAVDPDTPSPTVTYTLVDDFGGRFVIVGDELRVGNGLLLDFEQVDSYDLEIEVSDGVGGTRTQTFTVTIGDVNPEFIVATGADETFVGGALNDLFDGGAGVDTLVGGLGDDTYYVDHVDDVVTEVAGQGNDRVFARTSYTLAAGQSVELLATSLLAGTTAIDLTGNELGQTIYGNQGVNTLSGGGGVDRLYGFGDDDVLFGDAGNDILDGGEGNDTLDGGAGTDAMTGGLGDDTYYVNVQGDTIAEAAGQGDDRVFARTSYALAAGLSIELFATSLLAGTTAIDLTGNELGQLMYGNMGVNTLSGGGGNDRIYGFDGGDTLDGGLGNDTLDGGIGIDTLIGGEGSDTYYVDNAADTVTELAGQGDDRVFARVSYELGAGQSIELLATSRLAGTAAIDLTGNALGQTIWGNMGVNTLSGGGGGDRIYGFGGGDTLDGGLGNDALDGGEGDDRLIGGFGTDTLTGGLGRDTFVFDTAFGTIDTITDFTLVDDEIELDSIFFTTLTPGTLDSTQFTYGAAALDVGDRIIYNSVTGALFYDADGLGGASQIQFASLTANLIGLNGDHFTVV